VTLSTVSQIGGDLIDIHSQHQTLQLATDQFQCICMRFIEQTKISTSCSILIEYQNKLKEYRSQVKFLKILKITRQYFLGELDYNTFFTNESEEAQFLSN
jgi:DNA repair protein RecN (Recombination protein N)